MHFCKIECICKAEKNRSDRRTAINTIFMQFTRTWFTIPCACVVSIKLLCNFIKIILSHRRSPVKLLRIFRTPYYKNKYRRCFYRILWKIEINETMHETGWLISTMLLDKLVTILWKAVVFGKDIVWWTLMVITRCLKK